MSLLNDRFKGKALLDNDVVSYSEYVYDHFDYLRRIGKAVRFSRKYFYPAMVAVCTDDKQSQISGCYSHRAEVGEYKLTSMLSEIEKRFGGIKSRNDFRKYSKERFPIGQCAEQHAANGLLLYRGPLNIRRDIFFSKAVRPSTGEVFPYCNNCKKLFDL